MAAREAGFSAAEAVFVTAAARFVEELPEADQAIFQTVNNSQDMMASIEQHILTLHSPHNNRLVSACEKIDQFGKAMEPFFKIVTIFVSSHPEWSAIAWGAIRLVFLFSSHYVGFFVKLADMFEEFRRKLPKYANQVERIRERIGRIRENKELGWLNTYTCVIKALSFVYVDMLQFCHDACRLFTKKRRGVRYKAVVIWDLFWTPFDDRYAEILVRLQNHQEDFEYSVASFYSEQLINHFNLMDEERERNAQQRELQSDHRRVEEDKAVDRKLESLQRWISASNWTEPYESSKSTRLDNTGFWILKDPEYQAWLAQVIPYPFPGSVFAKNILVIAAKPGYGKTILSTRIIEDLQWRVCAATKEDQDVGTPHTSSIAFYYFDRQNASTNSCSTALKAIAAQLLFSQKRRKTAIDIASLMMTDQNHGQLCASDQVLEDLIRIYLQQLDSSFLVFDAIDECAEWDKFLRSLRRCAEDASCKIILITRPHLAMNSIIGHSPYRMDLVEDANTEEVRAIISPSINSMIEAGKFGRKYGMDKAVTVINDLVRRADSMVLWGVLMIKYLSSSVLTAHERAMIIEDEKPFKGLDNLYSKILEDLKKTVPKSEHGKVHLVFQWLVTMRQPWTATMLQTALAVQLDRPSNQEDVMENFKESILQLCGPLIEIRQDGFARFIHLSAAEYLTNPDNVERKSILSVDLNLAHGSAARLSLMYLLNEIPKEPLNTNASVPPQVQATASKYCLLPYVVTHWSKHATIAFEDGVERFQGSKITTKDLQSTGLGILLELLSRFIEDKSLITVFIEASWLFQAPPGLAQIPEHIAYLARNSAHPKKGKLLLSLGETLERLNTQLCCLNKEWGQTLKEYPNEIWLPSINSFTDAEFWVGTADAKIGHFLSPEDENSKVIVSQVSKNGKEVGIIRVRPSKCLATAKTSCTDHFDQPSTIPPLHSNERQNWEVSYEIWSLENKRRLTKIRFEIHPDQILKVQTNSGHVEHSSDDELYRFPVAISSSLRLVFIMGIIVQVQHTMEQDHEESNHIQQYLVDPQCPYSDEDDSLLSRPHKPVYGERIGFQPDFLGYDIQRYHKWLRCCFSPSEEYITVVKGVGPPSPSTQFSSWILEVYRNVDIHPNYRLIARSGVRLHARAFHTMLFHPTKPIIVLCLMSITVIWRFTSNDTDFITISRYPLDHMKFSDCGNFLHGVNRGPRAGEPVFLHLEPHFSCIPMITNSPDNSSSAMTFQPDLTKTQVITSNGRRYDNAAGGSGQMSQIPKFTNLEGQLQISALSQDSDSRSVVLQTMRADGKMIEETITRLPQLATLEKSYSTLVPAGCHKNLRLILNMAIQETYSVNEHSDYQLPVMLERTIDSIPRVESTWQAPLEATANGGKRPISDSRNGYRGTDFTAKT